MADTTSPLLGLLLMETGGDNNAWGANLNAQVITLLENAVAGVVTVASNSGSYSLTAAEARAAVIVLTGTLTADQTIVVPNTTKKYSINNQCTGNFFVLVKTASGSAVNAPAGKQTDIICYGSNVVLRADQNKVGEFFMHAGNAAPAGSFECDGSVAIRASAVDLYGVIGTIWGAGNGVSTYGLPDGKTAGKFLRSRTASVTVGTSQSNQNKSHTHTGSGSTGAMSANAAHTHTGSGTTGTDSVDHTHSYLSPNSTPNQTGGGGFPSTTAGTGNTTGGASQFHTHSFSFTTASTNTDHTHTFSFTTSTGSADGTEARPESLVGMLCIRY